MTTLTFTSKRIIGKKVGPASRFPAFREPIKSTIESRLDEDDELFINYGMSSDSLPYSMLDDYDMNELEELEFASAVLENEHMRAEFVLELGGRLWSLFDKDSQRELLTDNRQFLPCNLAIRNAWFAGGIEYNCGRRGHDINTCCDRFAARIDSEYGPVLRIYDYNVDRKVPYQMDFILPGDSKILFMRGRIENIHAKVVPIYFWTNMALPMTSGCRVVVPADTTYVNKYDGGSHFITKIAMPDGEGFDQTYPGNFPMVRDHFYNIPEEKRKYEALFNRDGSGFLHMSTRRLKGRKLFVWGNASGGRHWQRKLLAPGMCDYLEMQAGLAKTQQESLPMPPKTAWEWLEAYAPVDGEPEKVFADWQTAQEYTTELADRILPESKMESMLESTRQSIALASGKVMHNGCGSAALEELRRNCRLTRHLDFGNVGAAEEEWRFLLRNGVFNTDNPSSFTVDEDFQAAIANADDCWKKSYHRALYFYHAKDGERAIDSIEHALKLSRNCWTMQAWANINILFGNRIEEALEMLAECSLMKEADAYLIKENLKLLNIHNACGLALDVFGKLAPHDRKRPMVQFQYAVALAGVNQREKALAVLLQGNGLELPDAREGETTITKLFIELNGRDKPIPQVLDYITK